VLPLLYDFFPASQSSTTGGPKRRLQRIGKPTSVERKALPRELRDMVYDCLIEEKAVRFILPREDDKADVVAAKQSRSCPVTAHFSSHP